MSDNAFRATVDPQLCMGSGTCIAVAPRLFAMSDDGTAQPRRLVPDSPEQLNLAISRCPTGAIQAEQVTSHRQ
ncbi:MAG: ferredoxin [Actinomycetia bacterium]|nr:ferredoxin [Actinomycetes bacterium]MCH9702470.1 ferredoxin [Actinomycetes bacterium]MCH9760224.1 ferredoxin [Actinomycetes bacterium]